jgi:hypothetical protein
LASKKTAGSIPARCQLSMKAARNNAVNKYGKSDLVRITL